MKLSKHKIQDLKALDFSFLFNLCNLFCNLFCNLGNTFRFITINSHLFFMWCISKYWDSFKDFLTLPLTMSSSERSYIGKLKIVKKYLRPTMGQEHIIWLFYPLNIFNWNGLILCIKIMFNLYFVGRKIFYFQFNNLLIV